MSQKIPFSSRSQLHSCKTVVVKIGSAVITDDSSEKRVALGRLASLVDQLTDMKSRGINPLLVSSGAVAVGRKILNYDIKNSPGSEELQDEPADEDGASYRQMCASFGQSQLTSLFTRLFEVHQLKVAQVLIQTMDLTSKTKRENIVNTLVDLIKSSHCIPVINTNDASVQNSNAPPEIDGLRIQDNDNLAAFIAKEIGADLLVIFSDVNGVYTGNPLHPSSKFLSEMAENDVQKCSFTSSVAGSVGTGGMSSKVNSAMWALRNGCSVVISNGKSLDSVHPLEDMFAGKKIGTFFKRRADDDFYSDDQKLSCEDSAKKVKSGQRKLCNLTEKQRFEIVEELAKLLLSSQEMLLNENKLDLDQAAYDGASISRLKLTTEKIKDVSAGLNQLVARHKCSKTPLLGRCLRKTLLADGLELSQLTSPLGLLLVITESRPDVPPQVAALSICSGNGLLYKGGKESKHSNSAMAKLIKSALALHGCEDAFELVDSREEVHELIKLNRYIDLIIPRGSNALVSDIQKNSQQIPVLGHSEGICHVYVDEHADLEKTVKIVIDSKCDYPSACNSMETLLIHKSWVECGKFEILLRRLEANHVVPIAGEALVKLCPKLCEKLESTNNYRMEYGNLRCCVEIVKDIDAAIIHIELYGSHHTDCIVTESQEKKDKFLRLVDSANVYHNASTRFADGYRYGLGAEVGISTSKIHARGPVGIEGLLTTKWILSGDGHAVSEFSEKGGKKYIHTDLLLSGSSL